MSVKSDMLKKIEAKMAERKRLIKKTSKEQTIAGWVAEFFKEVESFNGKEDCEWLVYASVQKLSMQIHRLDAKANVAYEEPLNQEPKIVISWSRAYIATNKCEDALVMDSTKAFFETLMEQ